MPLVFTEDLTKAGESGALLEAYDGENHVTVVTSRGAIRDFGLATVQQKASEKYDAKQLVDGGRVVVLTSDLAR